MYLFVFIADVNIHLQNQTKRTSQIQQQCGSGENK